MFVRAACDRLCDGPAATGVPCYRDTHWAGDLEVPDARLDEFWRALASSPEEARHLREVVPPPLPRRLVLHLALACTSRPSEPDLVVVARCAQRCLAEFLPEPALALPQLAVQLARWRRADGALSPTCLPTTWWWTTTRPCS